MCQPMWCHNTLSWHSQPFMCLQQGMCETCARQLWEKDV